MDHKGGEQWLEDAVGHLKRTRPSVRLSVWILVTWSGVGSSPPNSIGPTKQYAGVLKGPALARGGQILSSRRRRRSTGERGPNPRPLRSLRNPYRPPTRMVRLSGGETILIQWFEMAQRGRWSSLEDELIFAAARNKRRPDRPGLKQLAEELGRTYAAVLKRASRIGARSYRPRRSVVCLPRANQRPRGGRGYPPWTEAEDELIRFSMHRSATQGPFLLHQREDGECVFISRLKDLAEELGRTPAAVRKRASRIGARSLPRRYDSTEEISLWRKSSKWAKRTSANSESSFTA